MTTSTRGPVPPTPHVAPPGAGGAHTLALRDAEGVPGEEELAAYEAEDQQLQLVLLSYPTPSPPAQCKANHPNSNLKIN